jgi:cytochrome bd-type quinol oxidase subunit 1
MGVVTGIVQEFQFGMNWSNYSLLVGSSSANEQLCISAV